MEIKLTIDGQEVPLIASGESEQFYNFREGKGLVGKVIVSIGVSKRWPQPIDRADRARAGKP